MARGRSRQAGNANDERSGGPGQGAGSANPRGAPQRRFDAHGLVASHGEIVGTVDAFDLDGVHDVLGDEDGEIPAADVHYRIRGENDPLGRPVLDIELDGKVPLQCQRCMRVFEWPVQQRTTLLLARDERELEHLDERDEREVLLASAPLDAIEIVEEELVLSLPYVPRCDRPDCLAVDAAALADDGAEAAPSAFGALAALKRGKPPE